jgi:tRNA threonylcarbamoyladenosine biosynthesis protein TsaB
MTVPYSFAPTHLDRQRAAAVAALAWSYYQEEGQACMVSADDFRPEYLRLAQAEQEHSERRSFSLLLEK